MPDINDAVKEIILYKGHKMKRAAEYGEYKKHIKEVFKEHNINFTNNTFKAFVMGGIDAMIYDVACLLDSAKKNGTISYWSKHEKRREILKNLWHE